MAGRMTMNMVVLATVAVMLVKDITAKNLTVGDGSGWTFPPSPDFYSLWAAKQNFAVGDILVFNFVEGFHTVAKVTLQNAYESCDATLDPNAEIDTISVELPLTQEGDNYFFCTISDHCLNGLKFAISVPSSPTTSPASSNPPASAPAGANPPAAAPAGANPPAAAGPAFLTSATSRVNISAFPVSFSALIISFAMLLTISQY